MLTKLSLKLSFTYSAISSRQKSANNLAKFVSEIKLIRGAVLVSIFNTLLEFFISSSSNNIHYCMRAITFVRIRSYFVSTFGLVLLQSYQHSEQRVYFLSIILLSFELLAPCTSPDFVELQSSSTSSIPRLLI